MEARNKVAMLPVQPDACHIFGGGDDAIEGGAAVWCMITACRRGVTVGSAVPKVAMWPVYPGARFVVVVRMHQCWGSGMVYD